MMDTIYPSGSFMVIPLSRRYVKFMTYQDYINSDEWRERVNQLKDNSGWVCSECGNDEHITGHHKTYRNIGNESAEDIEILCWECHQKKHPPIDNQQERV